MILAHVGLEVKVAWASRPWTCFYTGGTPVPQRFHLQTNMSHDLLFWLRVDFRTFLSPSHCIRQSIQRGVSNFVADRSISGVSKNSIPPQRG
jgi:hypothetical protein